MQDSVVDIGKLLLVVAAVALLTTSRRQLREGVLKTPITLRVLNKLFA